jgi:hypothetical protein
VTSSGTKEAVLAKSCGTNRDADPSFQPSGKGIGIEQVLRIKAE